MASCGPIWASLFCALPRVVGECFWQPCRFVINVKRNACGSELQFAGQIQRNGQAELKVTLSDGAQEHELTYPIHLARHPQHSLAPRAWAELLVALMSESGQSQLQELIYGMMLLKLLTITIKQILVSR